MVIDNEFPGDCHGPWAWQKVAARKQLYVDVWQILVGGEMPAALPGSKNNQLEIAMKGNSSG